MTLTPVNAKSLKRGILLPTRVNDYFSGFLFSLLWRRSDIKINISRDRMGDTKTLGLAEMEIKVNIVLNVTQL